MDKKMRMKNELYFSSSSSSYYYYYYKHLIESQAFWSTYPFPFSSHHASKR